MSCMMLTAKQIWTLAATISSLFNIGLAKGGKSYENYALCMNGVEWERLLRDNDCLDDYGSCKAPRLASLLHSTNVAAYNGRYSDDKIDDIPEEKWAEFVDPYCHDRGLARWVPYDESTHHRSPAQWHFDFLALMNHYVYQIEEDATRNSAVLRVMREQIAITEHDIVSLDPRNPDLMTLLRKLA